MRFHLPRFRLLAIAAVALIASGIAAAAQQPKSIRIGYAISKTGSNVGGASTTTLPNYQLWVKEVNAAGGIMLKSLGRRVPIEVIEYDDQSNTTQALKAIEQLATVDKVDFILAPWGTHVNLETAPLFSRYGYPHLPGAAQRQSSAEFAKAAPLTFFMLDTPANNAKGIVDVLVKLRTEGKFGNEIAMMHVADSFGTLVAAAAREALLREKFTLVYERTYPVGAKDLRPLLKDAMERKPDVFIAFSYPPDTTALTEQAQEIGFNPKVFFTGVGAAFPGYKKKFGRAVEGTMGMGGIDAASDAFKDYAKRHLDATGREPDRWSSPATYASLQILQQAIERAGTIDRAAVTEQIRTGTFDTIMGNLKFDGNQLNKTWHVGQWQDGEFYGIAPASMPGARPVLFPKPAWDQQPSN